MASTSVSQLTGDEDQNLITVPLLTDDNFSLWNKKMVSLLTHKKLLKYCLEPTPHPRSVDINNMVVETACIIGSKIHDKLYNTLITSANQFNPYEIWSKIKEIYTSSSMLSICRVWDKWLYTIFQEDLKLYISQVEDCLSDFDSMGFDIPTKLISSTIIARVTRQRPGLKQSMLTDENMSQPDKLIIKLKEIAKHDQVTSRERSRESNSSALDNVGSSRGIRRPPVYCTNHKHNYAAAHPANKCWEEHPDLAPDHIKKRKPQGYLNESKRPRNESKDE